jgi:putative hemolysin
LDSVGLEILIVLLLIVANGLFAMAEIAIVAARKTRLQQQANQGDRGARIALELSNAPNRFLSTTQIGITLIGIFAGAFGGATIADRLAEVLAVFPAIAPYKQSVSILIVVLGITYCSLIIGELVPKRLALEHAERIASAVGPFMKGLAWVSAPIVHLLGLSTDLVLRMFGTRTHQQTPVTEEELRIIIRLGTQAGVFEPYEQVMMERVLKLGDRSVSAIMTPRLDVAWIDPGESSEEILKKVMESGFSQFPVARGNLDGVLGLVNGKDILAQKLTGRMLDPQSVLRPALFIPASTSALRVLERFKEKRSHVGLVINEYGGFEGLVTLADILEAISGDIPLLHEADEPEVVQREDGSWLLDGMLLQDELKDLMKIQELPFDEDGSYQTLGGLVTAVLGRIPTAGDHFEWNNFRFEVADMDGRRVDKVIVTPIPDPAPPG